MTLTLRIEGHDRLEGGEPAVLTLHGNGARGGRARSMDWILPDPARHVSGHHFDISYDGGAYWLTDVSTNGTYLDGRSMRLTAPLRLSTGDRLGVGPYVIAVEVVLSKPPIVPGPHQAPPPPGTKVAPQARRTSPVTPAPLPRDPGYDPAQGPQSAFRPAVRPPAPAARNLQQPPSMIPAVGLEQATHPPYADPPPAPTFVPPTPPAPVEELSPDMPPDLPPPPDDPDDFGEYVTPAQAHTQFPRISSGPDPVVQAFCEGAGLDPAQASGIDPTELARALGETLASSSAAVMAMLQDRASLKLFARGGERTMLGGADNNPLKFLPDARAAIEVMFLTPRAGFMKGPTAMANALEDIHRHQMALIAALQPALTELLAGLSPEEIERVAVEGGRGITQLGGPRNARAWERYLHVWKAKAGPDNTGLADAFLKAYASAYAAAQNAQR